MADEHRTRLQEIARRQAELRAHRNDPYAYDPGEIDEVSDFRNHAEDDIDFLLELCGQVIPPPIPGQKHRWIPFSLSVNGSNHTWRCLKCHSSVVGPDEPDQYGCPGPTK